MYLGHFEEALKYYGKKGFVNHNGHFHRIGYVYWQLGLKEEAEFYFNEMISISNEHIESGYTSALDYYNIAGVYAFLGEEDRAFEYLRLFNQEDPDNIWEVGIGMLTLIQNDPLFDGIRDEPEFQEIVDDVEARFQVRHEKTRKWMEENDLL